MAASRHSQYADERPGGLLPRCRHCHGDVDQRFRFCPHCGAPLRAKLVEFFPAAPNVSGDAGRALRVSRYLDCSDDGDHTRFSIWNAEGIAEGVVSLSDADVRRLRSFLAPAPPAPPQHVSGRPRSAEHRADRSTS